jgi:hypothetical protein
LSSIDAVSIGTLPFRFLAAASLVVVESVVLETAVRVTLIRSIGALSFTVTVELVVDALTVGTGPLGLRITSTSGDTVVLEASEATAIVTFIRLIFALSFSVTEAL